MANVLGGASYVIVGAILKERSSREQRLFPALMPALEVAAKLACVTEQ